MRPPGFNQTNVQSNQNRSQGNNFNPNHNQNRGGNFNQNRQNNQGQVYQPPTNQPSVNQVLPYQPPASQIHGVSKTDFENYAKANDANMNNLQMKLDNFQRNQNDFQRVYNDSQKKQNDFQNMMLSFMQNYHNNSASTSKSSTLQNQTVTNPREHANAIITRSGKTCEGPSTPLVPTLVVSPPQEKPEQNPETSMEKVQKLNSENTAQVPPPEDEDSIFIEIPKPKAKKTINVEIQELNSPKLNSYQPKLPYPERMKVRENDKPSAQHKQRKLKEIAITTINAECSAIILNKVPEKLEDPGKFLIPCALQELDRTSALSDFGASINLLPHSIYKQLGLGALKPTRMTLELANCSITHSMGIAEDVVVRVDGFTFLADFIVVNFVPNPRVPIILGRPFLRTAKALIDLYEETLTLRVGKEELVYYADKSEKNKDKNFVHAISVIDFSKADPFSGSTTTHYNAHPPSSSLMKTSDNFEKFADELAPLNSLPPGNDDSTLKKDFHEKTFQIYSNPLFEFDDNFKSSNMNPLFKEKDKDVEIKSSPPFTLTSSEESNMILKEFEERDSIPPGIDLIIPSTLESSSSNPTSSTLTGEKIKEIEIKDDKVSSDKPVDTTVMTIRITFDNPIDFNDHFSKPRDFKMDLTVALDSTESGILPLPLLDSDLPITADSSTSITLISLGTEDKVFKPEPSFPLPPLEPSDVCLNFEPNMVIKNNFVKFNEDFYQSEKILFLNVEDVNSFTLISWTFLPYFTYPEDSPLIFSFESEDFVFDPGIVTFHQKPVAFYSP
ncbi:reverse transcriptase domain-containing protein [Tanacetum coccineum]